MKLSPGRAYAFYNDNIAQIQGVQRRMVLVVNFSYLFFLLLFYILDLEQDVVLTANGTMKSLLEHNLYK